MSVMSGVPVFRMADGSMTEEFLGFLARYNDARERNGLTKAPDWFQFSVAEMFRHETEKEAWAYWRWRLLRARVSPAEDYVLLHKLVGQFAPGAAFVMTSNCDGLHRAAGMPDVSVEEIHGSVHFLQCSQHCSDDLTPVTPAILDRMDAEPVWVPQCTRCNRCCLRPNVMIFEDDKLVHTRVDTQSCVKEKFLQRFGANVVVLEIGAGKVVASIRCAAAQIGSRSRCLVRINPDEELCADQDRMGGGGGGGGVAGTGGVYIPVQANSADALAAICGALGI
jgi:NAD-dependent SIR2 family protein deacetylase